MLTTATTIDPEQAMLGEVEMDGRDWWEEIHRRAGAGASIRAIARELDLDRKTVHRCLRQAAWRPYQRAVRQDTLLAAHAAYLRQRAAEVGYSAGGVVPAGAAVVARRRLGVGGRDGRRRSRRGGPRDAEKQGHEGSVGCPVDRGRGEAAAVARPQLRRDGGARGWAGQRRTGIRGSRSRTVEPRASFRYGGHLGRQGSRSATST